MPTNNRNRSIIIWIHSHRINVPLISSRVTCSSPYASACVSICTVWHKVTERNQDLELLFSLSFLNKLEMLFIWRCQDKYPPSISPEFLSFLLIWSSLIRVSLFAFRSLQGFHDCQDSPPISPIVNETSGSLSCGWANGGLRIPRLRFRQASIRRGFINMSVTQCRAGHPVSCNSMSTAESLQVRGLF